MAKGYVGYEVKNRGLSNIKIEWSCTLKEKEDTLKLNSFSVLISAITIFSSILSAAFLSDKQMDLVTKSIIAMILGTTFYILFLGINFLEKYFNRRLFYTHSFYEICIEVLQDLENEINKNNQADFIKNTITEVNKNLELTCLNLKDIDTKVNSIKEKYNK